MRTYSNIFIHIPGFTKSDLEFTCIVCGRPATKISTGYISPYCDDCYQQYYKDKPYSVIKNWYGWTGSNIENKQVVS